MTNPLPGRILSLSAVTLASEKCPSVSVVFMVWVWKVIWDRLDSAPFGDKGCVCRRCRGSDSWSSGLEFKHFMYFYFLFLHDGEGIHQTDVTSGKPISWSISWWQSWFLAKNPRGNSHTLCALFQLLWPAVSSCFLQKTVLQPTYTPLSFLCWVRLNQCPPKCTLTTFIIFLLFFKKNFPHRHRMGEGALKAHPSQ